MVATLSMMLLALLGTTLVFADLVESFGAAMMGALEGTSIGASVGATTGASATAATVSVGVGVGYCSLRTP